MDILFIIYVPIFLMLLYLAVGISIDVIAWLVDAIRQRRRVQLLASRNKLWWGQGASARGATHGMAPIAASVADDALAAANPPRVSASVSERVEDCMVCTQPVQVATPPAQGWNGVERRGQPRTLRSFRDFAELDEALDATMQAEQAEARHKLANSDVWHAIGLVQQRAVDDVRRLIGAIPRDTGHATWQQSLCQQLLVLADRYKNDPPDDDDLYWRIDDDQLSYYRPTVWEFVRAITVN